LECVRPHLFFDDDLTLGKLIPSRTRLSIFLTLAAFAFVSLHATEPRIVPDLNLKLMPIPAGNFAMGSPASEVGRSNNEGPQTRVIISQPFWLGQTEVTQTQWRAVMGTDLAEQVQRMLADNTLYGLGGKEQQTLRDYYRLQKDGSSSLAFNSAGDAPMYFVSWEESVAFCRRLTERERAAGRLPSGYEYRLPTEAEWEYACRAGTTNATYAGNLEIKGKYNVPVLDEIAWYGGNSSVGYTGKGRDTSQWAEKQYPGGTAAQRAVATKKPNTWGLYDMLGNVWEWCGDYYRKLPGGEVRDPKGPNSGSYRAWRGGSYSYGPATDCRAAARTASLPSMRVSDVGFRVALCPVH
jgi:formylglycine-generating enzyme required for sulfatase activity